MKQSDFKLLNCLGSGSYSKVYKVQRIQDGKFYAMKKVYIEKLNKKEQQNALNEIRILASLSHPHIVQFHEAFLDESCACLCIVMEYCQKGDLSRIISTHLETCSFISETFIMRTFASLL
jgi:NIMA (never in mitosis gene a)-related kinase